MLSRGREADNHRSDGRMIVESVGRGASCVVFDESVGAVIRCIGCVAWISVSDGRGSMDRHACQFRGGRGCSSVHVGDLYITFIG